MSSEHGRNTKYVHGWSASRDFVNAQQFSVLVLIRHVVFLVFRNRLG